MVQPATAGRLTNSTLGISRFSPNLLAGTAMLNEGISDTEDFFVPLSALAAHNDCFKIDIHLTTLVIKCYFLHSGPY